MKKIMIIWYSYNSSSLMVLVTGPTGSGKSTTLYVLKKLTSRYKYNDCGRSVEFYLKGVGQIQANNEIG